MTMTYTALGFVHDNIVIYYILLLNLAQDHGFLTNRCLPQHHPTLTQKGRFDIYL